MARMARIEVFAPNELAIVHVMNRVVRRCFLLGDDPVTGKNYDHRKVWIEDQLRRFSSAFGIDLLGFAILSNHFHLILRSRPDVVATWNDTEIARRWLMLCPVRKNDEGMPEEPNKMELNTIRNDPEKVAIIRTRLSDIGWWMRCLCQNIAVRANREDKESGKFFQSRFRAVRLLDEQALLACAAYVDLNPIRAAMAETLETSDFTSVQRRIQSLEQAPKNTAFVEGIGSESHPSIVSPAASKPTRTKAADVRNKRALAAEPVASTRDSFLSPLTLDERNGEIGAAASTNGCRCSDKGFLPMSIGDYLQLLDWTARQPVDGKPGATPTTALPIFERLSLDPQVWCKLVGEFGRLFYNVAGVPQSIDETTSRVSQHRYNVRHRARQIFAPSDPPTPA